MVWLVFAVVLCVALPVLALRYSPDRDHTRPPTYHPDRQDRQGRRRARPPTPEP